MLRRHPNAAPTKQSFLHAVVTLLLLIGATAGSRAAERVGGLGAPERLQFEGAKSFPPEAFRNALSWDLEFLVGAHPAAPLQDYLRDIEERLTRGYRHEGFPEARLAARAEGGNIVVRIDEGPRFRCGDIKVTNARKVAEDFFLKWAAKTGRLLGTNGAGLKWTNTEPASFTDTAQYLMSSMVTNAFLDLGFQLARFTVKLAPDRSRGAADYLIHVEDEGPRSVIGEIDVLGAVTNSPEGIVKFLGVKVGDEVNAELAPGLTERLRDCGRFLKHIVRVLPPDERSRSVVEIEVEELEGVAPLDQPLTTEQAALLKAREWLLSNAIRNEDVVIGFRLDEVFPALKSNRVEMVLSDEGVLAALRQVTGDSNRLRLAISVQTNLLSFFSGTRRHKLVMPRTKGQVTTFLDILPIENPETENRFNISVGGGFSTETNAPVVVRLNLAPAAFVELARRTKQQMNLTAEALTITHQGFHFFVDTRSGRPRVIAPDTDLKWEFASGALRDAVRELNALAADWPNEWDATNAVSSAAVFASREILELVFMFKPDVRGTNRSHVVPIVQVLEVLNRLGWAELFEPLSALKQPEVAPESTFNIPPDLAVLASPGLPEKIALFVVPLSDRVFDRGTWPWTYLREASLAAAKKGIYIGEELERIKEAEQTGPIGCLVAALLLHKIESPATRSFAIAGMTRLSSQRFLQDCATVLDGRSISCQMARRAVRAVQSIGDNDAAALAPVLNPEIRRFIEALRRSPRIDKDAPASTALAPALEAFWNGYLRDEVRAQLHRVLRLSAEVTQ